MIYQSIISPISSKGQVTLPVEVRNHLGVGKNDKVAFVIRSTGEVSVLSAQYPTITSLKGAAGTLKQPLSWKDVKRIAYEDRFKTT